MCLASDLKIKGTSNNYVIKHLIFERFVATHENGLVLKVSSVEADSHRLLQTNFNSLL